MPKSLLRLPILILALQLAASGSVTEILSNQAQTCLSNARQANAPHSFAVETSRYRIALHHPRDAIFFSRRPTGEEPRANLQRSPGREGRAVGQPLWPGSRFTESQREQAMYRGLKFIYRTSRDANNFDDYGADYLWCFYTLAASVDDPHLRDMALRMGRERVNRWRRDHRRLPPDVDAGVVADFAFGSDAADNLTVPDANIKEQIRVAAARFSARDYLSFDPLTEPPPGDVPEECENDGTENPRGSKVCQVCKQPLTMKSRYDVWYDALITTYSGDHYGVKLGAHYSDVLRWLPTMRPYRGRENGANPDFYDSVYAVTHVVYTLNNYSLYRLSPAWLPQEFAFLRSNLKEAIALKDVDMLGEFMDTLKSLGLTRSDDNIRAGMDYYLAHQNRDGSWGGMDEEDIYNRYHPTWNGICALSEYAWHGERLSFPDVKPLLEQWAKPPGGTP
jgi:hypothetical protein